MTVLLLALLAYQPITVAEIHDLVNAGRGGEALVRAESTALAAPADRPMQKAYALLLRNTGSLDSANAIYDRLLAEDPSDDDARLGKAISLSWQSRLDDALALYAEVKPGSESYFEALIGEGRVAGWAGRYREALRFLAEAESIEPGNREVVEIRARTFSWSGDRARAIALYRELLRENPENADYLFGLGQNYEWSGQPVTANGFFRRAQALAPQRKEISEAVERTAEAAAPQARLGFNGATEDDGGTPGTYLDYRFGYEQHVGDRLQPSAGLAYSSNRRDTLAHDYLLARAGLAYRPFTWLRLSGQAQADLLGPKLESATLGWGVEQSWFSWSGEAGRVLYEPAQDIGARQGWTALTIRPFRALKFEGRAGRTWIVGDGNEKRALSAGLGFDLLASPRLTVAYAFSYDDFSELSPRYYTPQDLTTNTLGLAFDGRWGGTGLGAGVSGGVNADNQWVARANLSANRQILPGCRASLDANWALTTEASGYTYSYGSLGLAVSRSF
ncbi:tetratricopeptide repeat protein [candidate division WOR-3 bacterium]|nr:tetratricopeptide repeat protein [candidate division WOR-3 bacterium]